MIDSHLVMKYHSMADVSTVRAATIITLLQSKDVWRSDDIVMVINDTGV